MCVWQSSPFLLPLILGILPVEGQSRAIGPVFAEPASTAVVGDDPAHDVPAVVRDEGLEAITLEDLETIMEEAQSLTSERVEELRTRLENDPTDLTARLRLFARHSQDGSDASARSVQALLMGLIEHHPRSALSSDLTKMFLNGPQFDEAAKLWIKMAEGHEDDPRVKGNAGIFLTGDIFTTTYRVRGEDYLKAARLLDPTEPRWALGLGLLYQMDELRDGPDAARNSARKALEAFESAYRLTSEDHRAGLRPEGQHIYQHLAKAAMTAGESEKAENYAEALLEVADPEEDSWNYGNAVFDAHTILGRVALERGDIDEAGRHLLDSGRTPGSPQLNSFGPSMILAEGLLERGETEAVQEFLDLCGRFWGSGEVDRWSQDIREGRKPDFGMKGRR